MKTCKEKEEALATDISYLVTTPRAFWRIQNDTYIFHQSNISVTVNSKSFSLVWKPIDFWVPNSVWNQAALLETKENALRCAVAATDVAGVFKQSC